MDKELKVGDLVKLPATEDAPEEHGKIIDIDRMPWGLSVMVEVEPEYSGDDGLRETTIDDCVPYNIEHGIPGRVE